MSTGVEARKTMKVSTLANCSVLMLAKISATKVSETGANATALPHDSASTRATPSCPATHTAPAEVSSCSVRMKLGAWRWWMASLLSSSSTEDVAM